MIAFDEDALICDLAETYQIYDYKQLPATKVAVFVRGLRANSRLMMKLSGQPVAMETMLLASISDRLGMLVWFQTEDGQKGRNRPVQLTELLTKKGKEKNKNNVVSFHSGKDFEKARKQMIS